MKWTASPVPGEQCWRIVTAADVPNQRRVIAPSTTRAFARRIVREHNGKVKR